MKKIKNAVNNAVGLVKKKSKKSSSSPLLEGIKNLASNVIKSNSALTGVASILTKAVNLAKPIIAKIAKQDQAKGKTVEESQLEKQYKNALKSRKGNATQWTLKDGTKCFFAVDAHGNIMDYGSIWFTTKDGKTFRIVKTQCVSYKGISNSTNDIGASLGNPIYKKVEGLNVLKAFIEILLTPISKIAASFLVYVIENMICNLTVVFDIVKLIVALDVKGLLQLVDTMALYLVGYNIVLFMLGTIIGLTSGVALAIAVAFGTAIFMILIDLAQIDFNLDLYMEQRGIDSYEELTGYFLAQVAEDAVYNFLLVNFMKFAKKAKIKLPSKVSNGVNKLNDKIKDAGNNVANKLDDMINKGNSGAVGQFYNLTTDEIEALVKYSGNSYLNINSSLRGLDILDDANIETVTKLQNALNKASLPDNMTLYRGTSIEALGNLKNLNPEDLIGKVITENGFMSTSSSKAVANNFKGNMQITINAPAGSKGLDISSISQYINESEVLFQSGSKMVITSAEKIDGVLYITTQLKK